MDIDILIVPYDSGHRSWRMGAGPGRLLAAGLAGALEDANHRTRLVPVDLEADVPTEVAAAFELARSVKDRVREARAAGRLPLVLSGNCGVALGTVAALYRPRIVWFDAHGDLHTPDTTRSGFLDGMALATLTGRGWRTLVEDIGLRPVPDERVDLVGARDIDPAEAALLDDSGIRAHGVDVRPEQLATVPGGEVYLHVDLDVLDPSVGRANPYATPGGFTLPGLLDLLAGLAGAHPIGALALASYDPAVDGDGAIATAAIRIATVVADAAARDETEGRPRTGP
jgi:arginase